MIKPRRLRPGDKVALVAPASPFPRDQFAQGVEELRRLGFDPVHDEDVFAVRQYVAGEAGARAAAFLRAWHDPEIRGVIAVRGGFGSAHLLPWLDPDSLRRDAKVFVGYSDLTSLLTHLTISCGIVAFHGPMLDRRLAAGADGYDRETFVRAVTSPSPLGELTAPNVDVLRPGEAAGPLLGGTLAQLAASVGTPYAFDPPSPHVLFLEDVGERPYRLDRMLTQLRFAGVLGRASAIVLGEFTGCDEPGGEPSARSVLADMLSDFPGPVLYGFPSGHTPGAILTLPFGVAARVVAGRSPKLVIEEAAVS